ncbi:MAG: hypothetical protein SV966_16660 [Actinomycetota bacterium]|nr:hypothetical protein [Actinomycetota bacterium]
MTTTEEDFVNSEDDRAAATDGAPEPSVVKKATAASASFGNGTTAPLM